MKTLPFIVMVLFFTSASRADDGYELWMKHRKINDGQLLRQYRLRSLWFRR